MADYPILKLDADGEWTKALKHDAAATLDHVERLYLPKLGSAITVLSQNLVPLLQSRSEETRKEVLRRSLSLVVASLFNSSIHTSSSLRDTTMQNFVNNVTAFDGHKEWELRSMAQKGYAEHLEFDEALKAVMDHFPATQPGRIEACDAFDTMGFGLHHISIAYADIATADAEEVLVQQKATYDAGEHDWDEFAKRCCSEGRAQ